MVSSDFPDMWIGKSPIERGASFCGKAGKRLDIERMFLYNTEQVCAFIDISGSQTEYGRM